MAKSLVVVESPAKAKTIRKYLGPEFEVRASVGHIIDLPKGRMGVDLTSGEFTPEYAPIPGKSKVIQELKQYAKKADIIYLALDPDREGEAIAFHVASLMPKNKTLYRVLFHEITKKAIQKAFEKPLALNDKLYDAQQARRILDRIVGYEISPLLWKKVQRGLSAGRVQSVAVRLVSEREQEIARFKPEEYWSLTALADAKKDPLFQVKLIQYQNKKIKLENEEQAKKAQKAIHNTLGTVTSVHKNHRQRKPSPPFITSKLQQEASRAFRFTPKRTMAVAQTLYEGVELGAEGLLGLITYMRTDSVRVSDDALNEVRTYIESQYGKSYLPEKPNFYKGKKAAQDAHEAIRPTSMRHPPDLVKPYLKPDQYKLYKLIWDRFVASQMTQALYDQTQIDILSSDYTLRATGSILRFEGYLKAYHEQLDEDDQAAKDEEQEEKTKLPDVVEGEQVKLTKADIKQHFTEPPPRFTEASLVKELEDKGIGRPSTYAAILTTIQDKLYAEKKENRLYPTELGNMVTELLKASFPQIMDIHFTAQLEEDLDRIEEGEKTLKDTLNSFYIPFQDTLSQAKEHMKNVKRMEEKTDLSCEKCGSVMVIKWSKNGSFLGCSNYPTCKNTRSYTKEGDKLVLIEPPKTDAICEKCSAPMMVKSSKYGPFLGCSRYPDCSFTMPLSLNIPCPKEGCGGQVAQKKSKKGKVFFGCTRYPACDFVSWDKPVLQPCPYCEHAYVVEKNLKSGTSLECPSCKQKINSI